MAKRVPKEIGSEILAKLAIKGLQEKKGKEITLLDLRKIDQSIADFFVIATATSDTQLRALQDSVEHFIKEELGEKPWQSEGRTNKEWILLDYADVVVHIFKSESRAFYKLENLWGDAKTTHIKDED